MGISEAAQRAERAASDEPASVLTRIGLTGSTLGFRHSALVELVLFFALCMVIDKQLLLGDRMWGVSPHPFWLPVILSAVQYGVREALLAALIGSLLLLVGNLPERSIFSNVFEFFQEVAARPMMWFVTAVVLGEMRTKQIFERAKLEGELDESRMREQSITNEFHRISKLKDNLEARMVSQMRTVVSTHQAARALEELDPVSVLNGATQLVRTSLEPKKFSIFLLEEDKLRSAIEDGWTDEDQYHSTLDVSSAIYQEVIGKQRFLVSARRMDREALDNQGVLAGPMSNPETGEVVGMLKIEKMGFLDLNVSNVENFRVLCQWVGAAYANARRYQDADADRVTNPDHQLYTYSFFPKQTSMLTNLARRLKFDVCMILVRIANPDEIPDDKKRLIPIAVNEATQVVMRNTDMAFDYQKPGQEFAVVLPATPADHMPIVREKLLQAMDKHVLSKIPEAKFEYQVQVLHRTQEPKE
ncbi:GAF domain-containing protein [Magnetofaba australis]|uniref:GAF domain-containing protein n=1 Tax=Magnetofaba australis IT-1 TaxID=1434232 RepID=A0A1Y2K5L5_9PROT|nr:GAF domain-containing protein [Magnetofaba australis]OSM04919.1 hypothetical protein MAIT1_03026 [Magnetofaba australis IT-1]